MKERGFISPGRYVQGQGLLKRLYAYTAPMGKTSLVILSAGGQKRLASVLDENEKAAPGQKFVCAAFSG